MTHIVVLGGTGYTGAHLAAEAASRGLEVTSWSRSLPESPVDGVSYETGDLQDAATLARAVQGADVVLGSVSPRGDLAGGRLRPLYAELAKLSAAEGARWVVIGGFSSLRLAEGQDRIAYGDDVPPQFLEEARTAAQIADDLVTDAPENLDWVFVSPAGTYGSYAPGEKVGTYRTSGEVALFDESGQSAIGGHDFAAAVIDEIVTPTVHRGQIGFLY